MDRIYSLMSRLRLGLPCAWPGYEACMELHTGWGVLFKCMLKGFLAIAQSRERIEESNHTTNIKVLYCSLWIGSTLLPSRTTTSPMLCPRLPLSCTFGLRSQ